MIKNAIEKLINKENLTYEEAYDAMDKILSGKATVLQNAAFLAALSTKVAGVDSIDEIYGCADAMRAHTVPAEHDMDVLEIVGTGGDGSSSFNISTTSAFVVAAAGIKVAKHGDRAASSKSGTADCLEALGIKISLEPEQCIELLEKVGYCFFYAQKYHPSMQYVGDVCKELGFRTAFNILGPLTNPANPSHYMMGVYEEYLVELVAKVLMKLGVKRGMVICGQDRLDEISLSAPTSICEIRDGYYRTDVIRPEDFGFRQCSKEELVGGTPEVNAAITRDILAGREKGAKRDIVLLNAGAAIYAADAAPSIKDGVEIARECLAGGKALEVLDKFIEVSNQFQ